MSTLSAQSQSSNTKQVRNPQKIEIKQEVTDSSISSPQPMSQVRKDDDTGSRNNGQDEQNYSHIQPDPKQRETEEEDNNSSKEPGAVDSDSDVEIVDEVINVSITGVRSADTKAKERILEEVTLEDDEDVTPTHPTSGPQESERPGPASKKRKVSSNRVFYIS